MRIDTIGYRAGSRSRRCGKCSRNSELSAFFKKEVTDLTQDDDFVRAAEKELAPFSRRDIRCEAAFEFGHGALELALMGFVVGEEAVKELGDFDGLAGW